MTGGKSSFFHFGAKTWRPKTADQQYQEMQRKMMADEEQMKIAEVQDRIKTLEQARRLDAKTQALNEMALTAELKAKGDEMKLRERQIDETKRLELAKLEIAKREGRESLSEADLARIRNERLKAENLAKAARDHAIMQNNRPVPPMNMGPSKVFVPPHPPVPHPLPPPIRPRSSHSMHQSNNGTPPLRAPSAQSAHRLSTGPPSRAQPTPVLNHSAAHRLAPPQATPRMRRMSDSHTHLTTSALHPHMGVSSHQPRGLTPGPYPNHHLRNQSANMSAEIVMRAHAERLRRRKLETLDLKARQHSLKLQALRDLRKRELAAELRDRGIQQREIETQVALLVERDRALNEAQLREMRDREHRLRLKEKGLQEREILDQVRRRQESDREAIRRDLELLERQLQYKELLDAELAIRRAIEKGESPPMGIVRPSIEEIETEGLLHDIYDDFDVAANPYLNRDMASDYGISVAYRPHTPSVNHNLTHTPSRTPNMDSMSGAPSLGRRPSQVFLETSILSSQKGDELLGDNLLRTPARSRSQSFDHHRPPSAASQYGPRQASRSRERESFHDRQNSHASLSRQEIASIVRAESRATLRDHEIREKEKAEKKAQESQRLRQELRAREEHMRQNSDLSRRMLTPSITGHQRTPSMRNSLDPNLYNDSHRLDIPPVRPSSRASSRLHDYDSISRPISRAGSMRDGGLSPEPPRLGLPSRPSSRNLTAEDLGLDFGRDLGDKVPLMNAAINDQILAARLASANYNREINGGTRSRANSRMDHPRNDEYLYGDLNPLTSDLNGMSLNQGRSRAGSHVGSPNDSFARNTASHHKTEFESNGANGMRSRSNSHARLSNEGFSSNPQRDHLAAESVNTGGRLSRASSFTQARSNSSPNSFMNVDLKGHIIGLSRSPHGHSLADHHYDATHGSQLTNEELSQLSKEQLELILNSRGVRSPMRNEPSNLPGYRGGDFTQQHPTEPLEALLRKRDSVGGSATSSAMNNLGIGSSQSRNLNHRSSHLELEHSPPFGESLYPHNLGETSRPLSRAESSRQYGGPNLHAQPYDQPIRSALANPASFARQTPKQHPERYHSHPTGHLYSNHHHDLVDQSFSDAADFSGNMNEDEFVITEQPEPVEARVLTIIGQFEASAPRSANFASRFERDIDREDMHQAVRNLISKTSRLGANGIVSLRVNDTDDGTFVATGTAVILEQF